jgi:hypothetical protein
MTVLRKAEIPLKQWVYEEAARCGVTISAIWMRRSRGKYPRLRERRKTSYRIFVRI